MSDPIGDVEREISLLVRRLRRMGAEVVREVHPDLEPNAFVLMHRLAEVGPVRLTDMACHFGVGKATMSRQLKALETLGLLRREPDPDDGRAWLLNLTDEGRERFMTARAAKWRHQRERLQHWDPADVAAFARQLARFNLTVD